MTAVRAPAPPPPTAAPVLRRDPAHGIVAGVCAGVARRLGVEPIVVRVIVVVAAAFGGAGVALYALGWAFIRAPEHAEAELRAARARTGSWRCSCWAHRTPCKSPTGAAGKASRWRGRASWHTSGSPGM